MTMEKEVLYQAHNPEQMVNGNPTHGNKSLWPAINYYLALTTRNGASANPLIVHRALLKCAVAVTANQVYVICTNETCNGTHVTRTI